MEKPWLNDLVDSLQPPSAEPAAAEPPPREQRAPENAGAPHFGSGGLFGGYQSPFAPTPRATLEYSDSTDWGESRWDRFVSRAPGIIGALLIVASLGVLGFFYNEPLGHVLISLGEKISGESSQASVIAPGGAPSQARDQMPAAQSAASLPVTPSTPAASPAPPAAPAAQPSSAGDNSPSLAGSAAAPANADLDSVAAVKRQDPVPASTKPLPSRISAASDAAKDSSASGSASGHTAATSNDDVEFRQAHQSFVEAASPQAKSRAVELLWAAVAKGSSNAEVELAGIYGRGDGVRKNCQQARILLGAATDLRNPLAAAGAAELRASGCR